MWIDRVLSSRTTEAVKMSAMFTEERHRILAKNVANIDTPGYQTEKLDPQAFKKSLRKAINRAGDEKASQLNLRDNAQFTTTSNGRLIVNPETEPAENVLFHDGTNANLESLLSETAKNQLEHSLAMKILASRYSSLLSAIRGKS